LGTLFGACRWRIGKPSASCRLPLPPGDSIGMKHESAGTRVRRRTTEGANEDACPTRRTRVRDDTPSASGLAGRVQGQRKGHRRPGWHRQAQLGDGGFPVPGTIAKAFGFECHPHRVIRGILRPPCGRDRAFLTMAGWRLIVRFWQKCHVYERSNGFADGAEGSRSM